MDVLIGLGGNVGDPPGAFASALDSLGSGIVVDGVSRLYRSVPVGPPQPEFWNMVALVRVDIPLLELLGRCQELEARAGRRRQGRRWGPRPLDLDLLIARGVVHRGPRLVLPHPHFTGRAFAMVPAAELAPSWLHPLADRRLGELAAALRAADPGAVRPVHGGRTGPPYGSPGPHSS